MAVVLYLFEGMVVFGIHLKAATMLLFAHPSRPRQKRHQDTGEAVVDEGNAHISALVKGPHDIPKHRQALVDLNRLLQRFVLRPARRRPLRSRQIRHHQRPRHLKSVIEAGRSLYLNELPKKKRRRKTATTRAKEMHVDRQLKSRKMQHQTYHVSP